MRLIKMRESLADTRYVVAGMLMLMVTLTGHAVAQPDDTPGDERGEHNGVLLSQDDFTVELAIVEDGIPPEFRAWAYSSGTVIGNDDWTLELELTRLGGEVDHFAFVARSDYLEGQGVVGEPHSFDISVSARYQGREYRWQYASHEGRVLMSPDIAEANGIGMATAGPGELHRTLLLYGRTSPDPQQLSHITARYPGLIRSVGPALGDEVEQGQTIAVIEANNSLQPYELTAPISGRVVERHANPGEMSGDRSLMTIANYDRLWVDLAVFPGDMLQIRPGLPVTIRMEGQEATSSVRYLNPGEGNTPTVTARVPLPNPDMRWSPGLLVEGLVGVENIAVDLMIDNRALQSFRDWQVVFINIGDEYEIRPLTLGRTDGRFTEVLDGLEPGDRYVVENSFLLKADLEKDGASHDH